MLDSLPHSAGRFAALLLAAVAVYPLCSAPAAEPLHHQITKTDEQIVISTPQLEAAVRKQGYVSGIAGGSFLDKKTGFRDRGHGLDIVDWLMEPGSDKAYRDQLDPELVYRYDNPHHGRRAKRSIEGPQICTKARKLDPQVIRGPDFTAVRQSYRYHLAAPGKKPGSLWEQVIVLPRGKRYFISRDRITSANDSPGLFLRIDMPGHIKHNQGDTFSEVYLSYHGRISAKQFTESFPPDQRYNYRRGEDEVPSRFIRAYRTRDPETGKLGPWLAGMTLAPEVVHEAWCHQRGYVCMIQEFGGRPIQAGESFSAAFIVGYFDSIEEMHQVYDRHRGHVDLQVTDKAWQLLSQVQSASRK